ncbi:MAG: 4-hydroxy-tetrahydrodipicolinate reductase [Candidatus Omnitrophota bacterium]
MLRVGISGIGGKMGKRIADLAMKDGGIEIGCALEKKGSPMIGNEDYGVAVISDVEKACRGIDCMIDFTSPEATLEHIDICARNGIPMVIGTTGLDDEGGNKISEAAGKIPIVFSPNMAIGVNLLFNLVDEAARVLGKDFEVKIDETHHVHKKDSPSGTAKMIAKVIKGAADVEAPIEVFREGEVIGNHGIVFDGKYEKLEIRHDAKSRDVFAAGAIEAAKFVAGKAPGLYTMANVLGLKK